MKTTTMASEKQQVTSSLVGDTVRIGAAEVSIVGNTGELPRRHTMTLGNGVPTPHVMVMMKYDDNFCELGWVPERLFWAAKAPKDLYAIGNENAPILKVESRWGIFIAREPSADNRPGYCANERTSLEFQMTTDFDLLTIRVNQWPKECKVYDVKAEIKEGVPNQSFSDTIKIYRNRMMDALYTSNVKWDMGHFDAAQVEKFVKAAMRHNF